MSFDACMRTVGWVLLFGGATGVTEAAASVVSSRADRISFGLLRQRSGVHGPVPPDHGDFWGLVLFFAVRV